jgi:hypothetical protein
VVDIKHYQLDAAFASLKQFDTFAKDDDFIEVVLWNNGEGFDAHISGVEAQHFSISWGQFKAIKKLVKELDN